MPSMMTRIADHYREATPWRKSLIWIGSLFLSSIISLAVKEQWEAPRPLLQLGSLTIDVAPDDSTKINLDPDLKSRILRHPFFPDLAQRVPASTVTTAIHDANEEVEKQTLVAACLSRLHELVTTQSSSMPVEGRRRAYLEVLTQDPEIGREIDHDCKIATDEYEAQLPRLYMHHPALQQSAVVRLRAGNYDLSEINGKALAQQLQMQSSDPNVASRVLLDSRRTNTYRRMLLYFEPSVLGPFLDKVRTGVVEDVAEAKAIGDSLQERLPLRAIASLVVTNRGVRPLSVLGLGLLKLRLPINQGGDREVVKVPMLWSKGEGEVLVVDGGKASVMQMESRETIREIVDGAPKQLGGDNWVGRPRVSESRLMLMYSAQAGQIEAALTLGGAGYEGRRAKVGQSRWREIGRMARENMLESLGR